METTKQQSAVNSRSRLLRLIYKNGPIPQAEAARQMNASKTVVSQYVKTFRGMGLLERRGTVSTGGRPGRLLQFKKSTNLSLGVVFEYPEMIVGLSDFSGRLLKDTCIDLGSIASGNEIIDEFVKVVAEFVGIAKEQQANLRYVVVGCPGPLDPETGAIGRTLNWPAVAGVDFEEIIRQRFGLPGHVVGWHVMSFLGNFDPMAETRQSMMICWDDGVGCTVGRGWHLIYPVEDKKAMELWRKGHGHVIIEPEGRLCRCGQRGCLEAYYGGYALVERLKERDSEKWADLTYPHLVALAASGDSEIVEIVRDAAGHIGKFFGMAIAMLGVSHVKLAGHLGTLESVVLEPFKEGLARHLPVETVEELSPACCKVSRKTDILGACRLATHLYFDEPYLKTIRL